MDFKEVFVESSYPHTLRIPGHWVFTQLSEAINVIGGSQPPKSEFSSEPKEGFVRLIQIRDYKSDQHQVFIPRDKARRFVKPDDVMIGRYGPPIFQILKGLEGAYNVALMKAEPVAGVMDNRYLYFYLQNRDIYNYVEAASDRTAGQSGVNKEHLEKYPVGLPPLAEQKVIADKLDTLLAQVDNTKARLERIPEILKSFRQSVLAAAVSGKLTEAWDATELSVKDLCIAGFDGPFGSKLKSSDYSDSGVRVARLENIGHLYFDNSKKTYISEVKYSSLIKNTLENGDVLFSSFVDETVNVCVFNNNEETFINKADCFCLRPRTSSVNSQFLSYVLASRTSYEQIKNQVQGVTRPRINLSILKGLTFKIPPIEQQLEIVLKVEELFAFADRIEQAAQAALSRVNNLTQSILAKAFRGELTADWRAANPDLISGDNSAEALLDRIKAERAAFTASKRDRKAAMGN